MFPVMTNDCELVRNGCSHLAITMIQLGSNASIYLLFIDFVNIGREEKSKYVSLFHQRASQLFNTHHTGTHIHTHSHALNIYTRFFFGQDNNNKNTG